MKNFLVRSSLVVGLGFGAGVLGCSSDQGDDSSALDNVGGGGAPAAGRAGIQLTGGMGGVAAGAGGVGGMGGSGAGTGGAGTGGTGAGGAGAGMGGMGPACAKGTVDCNGSCVGPGESAGGCTLLSLAGDNATIDHGLSLDDGYVYWAEQSGRVAVARVAKGGGAREDLIVTKDIPYSPSPTATQVFFSTSGFSESALNVIPKAGGTATVIGTNADSILNVVANEARVYFSREHFLDSNYEIVSVAPDGTDEIVHATTGSFRENQNAIDSTHLYFLNSDFFDPTVLGRTTLDGTTVETVTSLEDISAFALAGDSIVLYETSAKALYTVPKSGGTAALLYKPTGSGDVVALAASDRFAYWATSKSVWRVGLDGTGAVALLQTTNNVQLIAVDGSGLYAAIDTASYMPPAYVVKIAEPN